MNRRLVHLLTAVLMTAGAVFGSDREIGERGMFSYIVVLREEGAAKNPAPDVVALGGKVVSSAGNRQIVLLSPEAAEELSRHPRVAYLQRRWDGQARQSSEPASVMAPLRVISHAEPGWKTGVYAYDGSGNVEAIGTDSYAYDSVGRLIRSAVSGTIETYKYDWFGNLELAGATANSATNQLTAASYDAAGNVISDHRGAYRYDAASMMTGISPIGTLTTPSVPRRMIYTADDERVAVVSTPGGTAKQTTRITLRDVTGKVLREFERDDFAMEWRRDYIHGEGLLVGGERQVTGGDNANRHYHLDHLGSVRLITRGGDGARISDPKYLPFGNEVESSTDEFTSFKYSPLEPMKFTGHERDYHGVTNIPNDDHLDYMHARYYSARAGRFLSVDPVLDTNLATLNPQAWNRYAYVRNNPINKVDPNGRYEIDVHRNLTLVLARAAGFSGAQAAAIANADQGVDEDPKTQPFATDWARVNYHFTSFLRRDQMWADFMKSGSLTKLGQFMHAEQDSFSHAGFSPYIGHVHAGHRPDKTYLDGYKAMAMAASTYRKLNDAADKLGISRRDRVAWKEIRTALLVFAIARTQAQKDAALKDLRDTIEDARKRSRSTP